MTEDQSESRRTVETLLDVAGIPVPEAEIEKLVVMYHGGAAARAALRAPVLGETEPVTVFAPQVEVGDV